MLAGLTLHQPRRISDATFLQESKMVQALAPDRLSQQQLRSRCAIGALNHDRRAPDATIPQGALAHLPGSRPWPSCLARAARSLLFPLAMLLAAPVHAAQVALSDSDFSLGLDEYTEAGSWASLDTSNLDGVFGPHRCQCPGSFSPVLQLTSAGQTDIGASTIGVTFYLGSNCYSAPASCASLGQSSFSASEGASPPTFSSSAVFEAASDSTSPSCTSLSASSTTLWAILTQNGTPLTFSLTIDLPISNTTVGTPTGVTAQPANEGLLVSWSAPADASLVAGYQVLCLPRPITASAAGYESCGLVSDPAATVITPDDETQLCSAELSASASSVRVTGLTNGTTYTVAVIAIDPSGGTGAPSSPATATPQTTIGFWDEYEQAGGAATGCSLSGQRSSSVTWPLLGSAIAPLILFRSRHRRRRSLRRLGRIALLAALLVPTAARAQESLLREPPPQELSLPPSLPQASPLGQSLGERDDATLTQPVDSPSDSSPEWGIELGVSLYRPDVDGEFRNGAHPFADTFSSSRHIVWAAELDRYLLRRFGTWGLVCGPGITGPLPQPSCPTRSRAAATKPPCASFPSRFRWSTSPTGYRAREPYRSSHMRSSGSTAPCGRLAARGKATRRPACR